MQSLDPSGQYTDAEVKAALSGVGGTRDWSFRYAHLDSQNNYLGDLDSVQSCTINNDFLADIKRTAKFSIVDDGGINYLQDRIQPFARLSMHGGSQQYNDFIAGLNPDQMFSFDGYNDPNLDAILYQYNLGNASTMSTFSTAATHVDTAIGVVLAVDMAATGTTGNASWVYRDVSGAEPLSIYVSQAGIPSNATVTSSIYYQAGSDQTTLQLLASGPTTSGTTTTYFNAQPRSGRYYVNMTISGSGSTVVEADLWFARNKSTVDSITGTTYTVDSDTTFTTGLINDGGSALAPTNTQGFLITPPSSSLPVGPLFDGNASIIQWVSIADGWTYTNGGATHYRLSTDYEQIHFQISDGSAQGLYSVDMFPYYGADGANIAWDIPASKIVGLHCFAFTISTDSSASNLTLSFFSDGNLVGSTTVPYWNELSDTLKGGHSYVHPQTTYGRDWTVDTMAFFYGKTLTDNELTAIYTKGLAATPPRKGYVEWPQGVFILSSPKRTLKQGTTIIREVDAYDQLLALKEASYDYRYTVAAGANCVTELLKVLGVATRKNLCLNPTVYGNSQWWSVGTGTTTYYGPPNAHAPAINSFGFTSTPSSQTAQVGFPLSISDAGGQTVTFSTWVKPTATLQGGPILEVEDGNGTYSTVASGPVITLPSNVWTQLSMTAVFPNLFFPPLYGVGASVSFTAAGQKIYIGDTVVEVGTTVGGSFSGDTPESSQWSYTWTGTAGNSSSLATSKLGKVPPSTQTFTLPMEWVPGTSKLKIVNDILAYINYESAWYDENGVFRARPYQSPSVRGAEFTYATDSNSVITTGDIDQTIDLFSVPNEWVLIASNPEASPLVSTYINSNPLSPTSTVSRGRTIVDYRTEQGASDQATLDAKVARLAFEASQVYEVIDFNTAIMPIHSNNDVYNIVIDDLVVDNKYEETSWSMDLDPGSSMKHSVRRISTL